MEEFKVACKSISDHNIRYLTLTTNLSSFVLPDCFYSNFKNLLTIKTVGISFQAGQGLDPLTRLAKSASELVSLTLEQGATWPEGVSIDWNNFFMKSQNLETLSLTSIANLGKLFETKLSSISTLRLINCSLIGPINGTFLQGHVSSNLTLDLAYNRLTITDPPMFSALKSSQIESIQLSLRGNDLGGSIPPLFPVVDPGDKTDSTLRSITVDFSSNRLKGPISPIFPQEFFDFTSLLFIDVQLQNNGFTDTIPTLIPSEASMVTHFKLNLASNNLSGTISPSLLTDWGLGEVTSFELNLANNQLYGDVPALFNDVLLQKLDLNLSGNRLNGSIANGTFSEISWDDVHEVSIDLSGNALSGDFPSPLLQLTAGSANPATVNISFANNPFNGSLPSASSLFQVQSAPNWKIVLNISNTNLTQALVFDSVDSSAKLSISLYAASTKFTSVSFSKHTPCYMSLIDISNSPSLGGTIPLWLFPPPSSKPKLTTFLAAGTNLSGTMPNIGVEGSSLAQLVLNGTSIDFCATPRNIWESKLLDLCNLNSTSAVNCNGWYPTQCFGMLPPPACTMSTQPSPNFACIDGRWTFGNTVSDPIFTLPSGASETVVTGNVTSPALVISGIGSTLVIQGGCATNLSSITIELTKDDLKKLNSTTRQLLLSTDPTLNCSNLEQVQVALGIKGTNCRKVKVDKLASDGQISALLFVDKSACRTWWIILVAVLCSVVVIGVIVFVLLAIFVRPVRECIRPYSKPREHANI